jgi:hypothetical protein
MSRNSFPSPRQARTLACGLGWLGLGLGLLQLLEARRLARAVGLPGQAALMAACGARELATGVGLLRGQRPATWLWGRVAGDVMDAVALSAALQGERRGRAALALGAVAGVAVLDVACARALSRPALASTVDYSRRSGWPLPPSEMRGAALEDFTPPRDMRIPEALRPWPAARGNPG